MVFYNRSNEAAARLQTGDFDWKSIFAAGVRWFHSGGIFAALSATTPDVILEAMKLARKEGAIISFDLNFREKLWHISGGLARAQEVLRRIVDHVDVLVGNEEDLQKGLGIPGPEVAATSKLDPSAFFGMMDRVVAQHPGIKIVATTLREVHSTSRHQWSAIAWVTGHTYVAPEFSLDVLDRVGGGDGFASGFFYGLMNGLSPEEALRLGWAHGAVADHLPGRYDDGDPGTGPGFRSRRVGPHSALKHREVSDCDTNEPLRSMVDYLGNDTRGKEQVVP